jgi:hypothetical protein
VESRHRRRRSPSTGTVEQKLGHDPSSGSWNEPDYRRPGDARPTSPRPPRYRFRHRAAVNADSGSVSRLPPSDSGRRVACCSRSAVEIRPTRQLGLITSGRGSDDDAGGGPVGTRRPRKVVGTPRQEQIEHSPITRAACSRARGQRVSAGGRAATARLRGRRSRAATADSGAARWSGSRRAIAAATGAEQAT